MQVNIKVQKEEYELPILAYNSREQRLCRYSESGVVNILQVKYSCWIDGFKFVFGLQKGKSTGIDQMLEVSSLARAVFITELDAGKDRNDPQSYIEVFKRNMLKNGYNNVGEIVRKYFITNKKRREPQLWEIATLM